MIAVNINALLILTHWKIRRINLVSIGIGNSQLWSGFIVTSEHKSNTKRSTHGARIGIVVAESKGEFTHSLSHILSSHFAVVHKPVMSGFDTGPVNKSSRIGNEAADGTS